MGQFSWITQDTNEPIRNNVIGRLARAYMHDNKGNVWEELEYEGYGEFGGKDFYILLAEMNNLPKTESDDDLRSSGIDLYFSGNEFLSPNLTRNKEWVWRNIAPEDDPDQGWGRNEDNLFNLEN